MLDHNSSHVSALNHALVEELKRKRYIRSPQVEAAFRAVPRHLFLPGLPLEEVYADRVILTKQADDGHWLSSSSQPGIMAVMLEQLDLVPGHKVLEIGAGTGYNAALMAHMVGQAGQVVTLDIEQDLVTAARQHLAAAGFERAQAVCADGGYGYPAVAPYDRVILSVGSSDIMPAWIEQMQPHGRLVLPLAIKADIERSIAFERNDDHLLSRSHYPCGFLQLRGAFAGEPVNWLPLGSEPGLLLAAVGAPSIDAQQVYTWLTGPGRDWETGIHVSLREIDFELRLWLLLHGLEGHSLVARGELADRDLIPALVKRGGQPKSASADVLLGDKGMASLARPPGQSAPLDEDFDPCLFETPFALYVRQFGLDESPARRLVEQIRAWHAAGRPSARGLRIRAYPKHSHYTPADGEFVVDKQWTRLVLDWPATG